MVQGLGLFYLSSNIVKGCCKGLELGTKLNPGFQREAKWRVWTFFSLQQNDNVAIKSNHSHCTEITLWRYNWLCEITTTLFTSKNLPHNFRYSIFVLRRNTETVQTKLGYMDTQELSSRLHLPRCNLSYQMYQIFSYPHWHSWIMCFFFTWPMGYNASASTLLLNQHGHKLNFPDLLCAVRQHLL